MIYTSFFGYYKGENGVSVARGLPKHFKGVQLLYLCPTWQMIKGHLPREVFEEKYKREILSRLDPYEIGRKLEGKVILCWERTGLFCHRSIIADWLRAHGHQVDTETYELGIKPPKEETKKTQLDLF